MRKKIFILCLLFSTSINICYVFFLYNEHKHRNEFVSLFKIKNVTFKDGNQQLKKNLNDLNDIKPYHLIHIWDTMFLEAGIKIPYITNLDSVFGLKKHRNIDCILMSSMQEKSIRTCLESRKIELPNLIIMNEMDDYVSGLCNFKKVKYKPTATILINRKGEILFYNDRLIQKLSSDTMLMNKIEILK